MQYRKQWLIAFSTLLFILYAAHSHNRSVNPDKYHPVIPFYKQKVEELEPGLTEYTGYANGMPWRVILSCATCSFSKDQITQVIFNTFKEIHEHANIFNANSELSLINKLPANHSHTLSPILSKLLHSTDEVHRLTQGRFDPTIGPVCKLWKRRLEQNTHPAPQEIERLRARVGWDKLHLEGDSCYKDHPGLQIDLSGIAKGFAVDMILEGLQELGYKNIYVEWAGEIRTQGLHPEKRPWKVGIEGLATSQLGKLPTLLAQIELKNEAIATSGNTQQRWVTTPENSQEPTAYTHIIDPRTLYPLPISKNKVALFSVKAANCALADALATSGMLFNSPEEANAWIAEVKKQHPNWQFWYSFNP